MRLKLLIIAIPLMLPLGGCVIHFPLGENSPSLASQEEPSPSSGDIFQAPSEPNSHAAASGNSANTPDLPQ